MDFKAIREVIEFNIEDLKKSRELCNELIVEDVLICLGLNRKISRDVRRVHGQNIDYVVFDNVAILTQEYSSEINEEDALARINKCDENFECFIVNCIEQWAIYNKNKEKVETVSLDKIENNLSKINSILTDKMYDFSELDINKVETGSIDDFIETLQQLKGLIGNNKIYEANQLIDNKLSEILNEKTDNEEDSVEDKESIDIDGEDSINVELEKEDSGLIDDEEVESVSEHKEIDEMSSDEINNLINDNSNTDDELDEQEDDECETDTDEIESCEEDDESFEEDGEFEEEIEGRLEEENELDEFFDNNEEESCAEDSDNEDEDTVEKDNKTKIFRIEGFKGRKDSIKSVIISHEDGIMYRCNIDDSKNKSAEEVAIEIIENVEMIRNSERLVNKLRRVELSDIYKGISKNSDKGTKISGTKYYIDRLNDSEISEFVCSILEEAGTDTHSIFIEFENDDEEDVDGYILENVINVEYIKDEEVLENIEKSIMPFKIRGGFINNAVLDENTLEIMNKVITGVIGVKTKDIQEIINTDDATEFVAKVADIMARIKGKKDVISILSTITVAGTTQYIIKNPEDTEEDDRYEDGYSKEIGDLRIYKTDLARMIYTMTEAFARLTKSGDIVYDINVNEDAKQFLEENFIDSRVTMRNIRNITISIV